MSEFTADFGVVGSGANGISAARWLSEQGFSVKCFDQAAPPFGDLSSHKGETRVDRVILPDGKFGKEYTEARLSIQDEWSLMADRYTEKIGGPRPCPQKKTGFITVQNHPSHIAEGDGVHGANDYVTSAGIMAGKYGIEHSTDTNEVLGRFKQFANIDGTRAYYENEGSVLIVNQCIQMQQALAKHAGTRFYFNTKITKVQNEGSGVRMTTSTGEVHSVGRAIVASGAWLPDFLPPDMQPKIIRVPQTQYFFEADPALFSERDAGFDQHFPAFIYMNGLRSFVYGVPIIHNAEKYGIRPLFKIACEQFKPLSYLKKPESLPQIPVDSGWQTMNQLAEYSVGNRGKHQFKPVDFVNCIYTKYEDDFDFRIWLDGGILYVLACAGHGFKLSPWTGRESGKSVLAGRLSAELQPFNFERASTCAPSLPLSGQTVGKHISAGISSSYAEVPDDPSLYASPSRLDLIIPG